MIMEFTLHYNPHCDVNFPYSCSVSVCECRDLFALRLKKPDPKFEMVPRVYPVVLAEKVIGTAFVFQTQDSRSYVVSWFSEKQSTCRMIVQTATGQRVHSITLGHNNRAIGISADESTQNFVAETFPETFCDGVLKFKAVPPNGDQTVTKLFMVSRKIAHGCNDRLAGVLTTKASKICPVMRRKDGSYVRSGGFKSCPLGAPLVNGNDELVGMVTAFQEDVISVLSVKEIENLLLNIGKMFTFARL